MPNRPAKKCDAIGCHNLVTIGTAYCKQHKSLTWQRPESESYYTTKQSDPFYNSAAWRRLAHTVRREQPLCAMCGVMPSTVCDHIVPRSQGGADYEKENLQGLCAICHAKKSNADGQVVRKKNKTGDGG